MINPKIVLISTNPPVEFKLDNIPFTIGRDDDNDIKLDHQSVLRQHCVIVKENDKFILLDKQSTNGTYLNGTQIKEKILTDGDLIKIGRYEFVFKNYTESHPSENSSTGIVTEKSINADGQNGYEIIYHQQLQRPETQKTQFETLVSIIKSLIICCILTAGLGFIVCYAMIKGWITLKGVTEKNVWTFVIVIGCIATVVHIIWLTLTFKKSGLKK